MKILLTNDDGWDAPGLAALINVAEAFGEVYVVAPRQPHSGISHRLTLEKPMRLHEQSTNVYALEGTPADCVRIGLTQLGVQFDWVLSGINNGANLGHDVFVSGTVAGAREAYLIGTNAIALSQYRQNGMNQPFEWSLTMPMARDTLESLLRKKFDSKKLINVNFPDPRARNLAQIQTHECHVDPSPMPLNYTKTDEGFVYFGDYHERLRMSGRDVELCFSGGITISYL